MYFVFYEIFDVIRYIDRKAESPTCCQVGQNFGTLIVSAVSTCCHAKCTYSEIDYLFHVLKIIKSSSNKRRIILFKSSCMLIIELI